jgi:hypothetical protein
MKRDSMSKDDPQTSSEASPRTTRCGQALAVCLVVVVGLLAAIGVAVTRAEDATSSPPSTGAPAGEDTTTTTAVSKELVIETRLREILKVRDRALLARNAGLLSEIYTTDCKCLKDGRALIRQLRTESVVWKGVNTKVAIQETEEVNERLWTVVATVETPPVRIETESGKLIRTVPAERNLVRFALARPQGEQEWLLGHASSFN